MEFFFFFLGKGGYAYANSKKTIAVESLTEVEILIITIVYFCIHLFIYLVQVIYELVYLFI